MKRSERFRVGSIVRLRGYKRQARLESFIRDVPGGVVLDKALGGFHFWNTDALVLVRRARKS